MVAPLKFGADPEAFITDGKKIFGSERVIPEGGISAWDQGPKIVRDGVQIELQLRPSDRVEVLGSDITSVFNTLKRRLAQQGLKVSFDPVVDITKEELYALSEKSREFGCAVSYNLYGLPGPEADPSVYLKRSAGGHIHMGLGKPIFDPESKQGEGEDVYYEVDFRKDVVPLMDAIVGNTCVMLDRDPNAVERRKNYGKAGEYRLPQWGLEYRTLSNFWLRSYQLFGMVMGLSRLAVSVLHTSLMKGEPVHQQLLDKIDFDKMVRAIQTNDFDLAQDNWRVVRDFIDRNGVYLGDECGLNPHLLDNFEYFVKKVREAGLSYWFKQDPMESWTSGGGISWPNYLRYRVDNPVKSWNSGF